jgi:hypothetical protein
MPLVASLLNAFAFIAVEKYSVRLSPLALSFHPCRVRSPDNFS